jgi:hypothetical protein
MEHLMLTILCQMVLFHYIKVILFAIQILFHLISKYLLITQIVFYRHLFYINKEIQSMGFYGLIQLLLNYGQVNIKKDINKLLNIR